MQCDYYDAHRCRSCALMGVPYAVQLADKQQHCAAVLAEVAPGLTWLPAFASPESGFRNKAKLVVGGETGAVTLGILDGTGRGTDLRDCGLYEPGLHELIPRLADLVDDLRLEPYDVPSRRGELKHLIVTHSPAGAVMLRFVLRSQKQLALLRSRLAVIRERVPEAVALSVNLQPDHKAVLEGDTELLLTDTAVLPMQVNGITLNLRPNSFFQTNTSGGGRALSPSAAVDLDVPTHAAPRPVLRRGRIRVARRPARRERTRRDPRHRGVARGGAQCRPQRRGTESRATRVARDLLPSGRRD